MKQPAGHCDRCGAALVGPAQLTVDDGELCESCVLEHAGSVLEHVKREAANDGR